MQLSKAQEQDIVTRIKQSETFNNAYTNSSLLQYLYDATSNGDKLKEEVVNIEFYGKNESTNKSSTRVRVNVFNLRKKLEAYYNNEGKNDKCQLVIEKGQYQVTFVNKSTFFINLRSFRWSIILPYLALIISISILLYTNLYHPIPSVWKSILSKSKSTNVYIGDMFGMSGITSLGTKGWIRSFDINSYDDFNNMLKTRPEMKERLKPSTYTYTSSMTLIAAQRMQKFFQDKKQEFQIRFATKSSAADIIEGNAIYIGSTGNDNRFIGFFNDANSYCKLSSNSLSIKNHPSIKDTTYTLNFPGDDEEYAIVSKYPAPNKTEHIVFFSRVDIGVTASVEYFTDTDSINHFVDANLNGHKYFTAILKVKGQDRTNTSIELVNVIPM